jgi:hypothetical protein
MEISIIEKRKKPGLSVRLVARAFLPAVSAFVPTCSDHQA